MDPATIGLLISIAPTVLDLLFGRGNNNSDIKHEMLLENPKEMYGYGLEGYGLEGYGLDDEYGLGFRYPTVPYVEAIIPRKSKKGKEFTMKKKIPKVNDKWVVTYLLNTEKKPPRKQSIWMKYLKEAFQQAKQKYDKYLEDLEKSNPVAYNELMKNRQKGEARKGQLPLALRFGPGADLYKKYKDYDISKLLEEYPLSLRWGVLSPFKNANLY
jgi:hypothetical protein